MNKLTKTQKACIEKMKYDIDLARKYDTFEEYTINTNSFIQSRPDPVEYFENNRDYYEDYRKYYDKYRQGIVLVGGYGKPTLNALEKLGIVTVIKYDDYRKNGVIDWVKLNNY